MSWIEARRETGLCPFTQPDIRSGVALRNDVPLWLRIMLGEGFNFQPLAANTPNSWRNEHLGSEGGMWTGHTSTHYSPLVSWAT